MDTAREEQREYQITDNTPNDVLHASGIIAVLADMLAPHAREDLRGVLRMSAEYFDRLTASEAALDAFAAMPHDQVRALVAVATQVAAPTLRVIAAGLHILTYSSSAPAAGATEQRPVAEGGA